MTIYRMAADATVCFDIEAATEDEAHAKAEKFDGPYDIREPAWPGMGSWLKCGYLRIDRALEAAYPKVSK